MFIKNYILMLALTLFLSFFGISYLEMALDSYEKEVGLAPSWMSEEQRKAAVVDRWYVDKETASCKPFQYLGSLGNFNNFVSKEVCQYHLTFTPEEQSDACGEPMKKGSCTVAEEKRPERWYFSKNAVASGGPVNSCHSFRYSGCGGNANNFMSVDDCNNACKNKKNGKVDDSANNDDLTATPNKFDCLFSPQVDNATPKMGVVLHKDKKRCVYAAIKQNALRGYFDDLPKCVNTCITEFVPACDATEPFQVPLDKLTTSVGDTIKEHYYFDKDHKACLPFLSKVPTGDSIKANDGSKNIFSSAELCASFCPAMKHLGDIKAVDACNQEKVAEWADGDNYKFTRYRYDSAKKDCESFFFNGKKINLNNFKSDTECEAICKTPLTTTK